ncbi:hypothetical protein WDV85_17005 [Pseudokineococcus sp. 5B2Z-1]|uniref:hypothetical protein n=1 Tax=Pseudokineococcus sp. 5B2Z-1 TaxID=3132744 RepID=UPI003096E636
MTTTTRTRPASPVRGTTYYAVATNEPGVIGPRFVCLAGSRWGVTVDEPLGYGGVVFTTRAKAQEHHASLPTHYEGGGRRIERVVVAVRLTSGATAPGGWTRAEPGHSDATAVILGGFRFHRCDGPNGQRLCGTCLGEAHQRCTVRPHP